MIQKVVIGLVVCLSFVSFGADFDTAFDGENEAVEQELTFDEQGQQDLTGHLHWDFITCVSSERECRREAKLRGFHHSETRRTWKCRGRLNPLACFGGHH